MNALPNTQRHWLPVVPPSAVADAVLFRDVQQWALRVATLTTLELARSLRAMGALPRRRVVDQGALGGVAVHGDCARSGLIPLVHFDGQVRGHGARRGLRSSLRSLSGNHPVAPTPVGPTGAAAFSGVANV